MESYTRKQALWPRGAVLVAAALCAACSGDGDPVAVTPEGPRPDARTIRCTQEFGDPTLSSYRLPYREGVAYKIIQGYCAPNPTWGHHDWLAYDFDMAIGDTILASRGGEVIASQEAFSDGTRVCGEENWIFIVHDDGTVMQYVHLTKGGSFVNAGQTVETGEAIGLSGDSGCSIGPHLHVALFKDRTNYDARNTIPLNYNNAAGQLDGRHGLVEGRIYEAVGPGGA